MNLLGIIDKTKGEWRNVKELHIFQRLASGEVPYVMFYDAAMLTLTEPVDWTHFIRPACLPLNPFKDSHLSESDLQLVIEIAGWGSTVGNKSGIIYSTDLIRSKHFRTAKLATKKNRLKVHVCCYLYKTKCRNSKKDKES